MDRTIYLFQFPDGAIIKTDIPTPPPGAVLIHKISKPDTPEKVVSVPTDSKTKSETYMISVLDGNNVVESKIFTSPEDGAKFFRERTPAKPDTFMTDLVRVMDAPNISIVRTKEGFDVIRSKFGMSVSFSVILDQHHVEIRSPWENQAVGVITNKNPLAVAAWFSHKFNQYDLAYYARGYFSNLKIIDTEKVYIEHDQEFWLLKSVNPNGAHLTLEHPNRRIDTFNEDNLEENLRAASRAFRSYLAV